ncbi:MAG: hypothetical protein NC225_08530 [Clostridium sp.]|nr:hypothetical protein [Clostridium sp.]MCM1399510.1 hypothetical protein [Clostridium sp.]MCM1460064.1 hypothetical protein [Bacteroides sp.]
MIENNACVIGDDKRMDFVAQSLYDVGYEVTRHIEASNADSIIVLPPPVDEAVTKQMIPYLMHGQKLYGGMLSNRIIHECELREIKAVDYLKIDWLTAQNAVLTAKGIIRQAIAKSAVPEGSDCLVIGYGYCGKAIAKELTDINASVDVMVRRRSLYDEITDAGYGFVDLNDYDKASMDKYSYLFNTVPAMVVDSELISRLSHNVMIFDIASAPGGTDFEYCNERGIFAMLSLGIPGREYPKEAGQIIAQTVLNDLSQG